MDDSLEEQRAGAVREYGEEWRVKMGILRVNLERFVEFWEVEKVVKLGFEEGEEEEEEAEERSCMLLSLTD